ncbi:Flavodoxin reductases (ferredoxin-NADPH reductases) family 1 [Cupriavidus sp. U2]|uniref:PDR/VanB family oxidoreductase n=1 Tax=Cupriavidus sp. U2 TaxID=2920269 RepID=UPI00129EB708|nr:PDR/VanB family oxidoreductase [Cupriavidus sp. U2]KAI3591505.1 Flavodoxin reductases (ferredoxin-NADPH reductases) family 1 [Cupriavidus sp. U2]
MQVRIASKTAAADGIALFELVAADGGALPPFTAGAHVDVHLGDGLVRQYSLCNDPAETHRYQLGVLRDAASRGGSVAMHALVAGNILEISAPKNHFPLHADARHSVLLAGGIGVTPILAMAQSLARSGASFEFHYCTRSAASTAFQDRIAGADLRERTFLYHDDGQRADLQRLLAAPRADTHLYVCGPSGFMAAVLDTARAAGWMESNLHREYFAAPETPSEPGGAFQVTVQSTGRVIDIAADETVVQALAAHGVQIQTSCEQGVCGTCLTRVLSGTPDHRDAYLTDEERAANDQFLPCCSRARTGMLVLDL